MGLKSIVLIGVLALIACDPGPMPEVPSSPDERDANYRSDSFKSDAAEPFPLDYAILRNNIDEVRRLLEQGADPNLRWGSDHFPLQEVLNSSGYAVSNPTEAVRLLLEHGADPNAKWCPFESRGRRDYGPSCTSARASTPLHWAAMLDSPEMVEFLLKAGADATMRDWRNGSALDYAYDEIVFETIGRALFPEISTRNQKALAWLKEYDGGWHGTNAWESTPLSRALGQLDGGQVPPPPPIPIADLDKAHSLESRYRAERESRMLGRVRTLIRIGADPNERATRGGADWTPIAMAQHNGALRAARFLLENGADPNRRTCVDLVYGSFSAKWTHGPAFRRNPACTLENGVTPLIFAARSGDLDAVTLLLEFRADRTLKDWAGGSAQDYATDPEVRKLLLNR